MKENINKCLNQTKYMEYISEVERELVFCKNASKCVTQFMINPKSNKILAYEEMLMIDELGLLGNLGGLFGLFVGFSVFGYASILVDLILENIQPRVLRLIPGIGPNGLTSPSNGSWNKGLNGGGYGNASNLVGMAKGGAHPGSRGSSGGSWSIKV